MVKYYLIDTNVDPSVIIREITISEYEKLLKNQEIIAQFKYELRRIKEIRGNYLDLKKYHFDAQEMILKKPEDIRISLEDIFINYNRLLINFCSSLKFGVDYLVRKTYDISGEEAKEEFKAWLSTIYDSLFSYRLFYNLRNFVQHREYPLRDFKVDRERYFGTSKIRYQELFIMFDKEYLLKDDDLNRKLNGLDGFGEYFPIQPYLLEIERIIDLLKPKVSEVQIATIKQACTELDEITKGKKGLSFGYVNNKSYTVENNFMETLNNQEGRNGNF